MRIVSLLPSLTELVCALGRGDELVGVTHECDFPPGVEHLAAPLDPEPDSYRGDSARRSTQMVSEPEGEPLRTRRRRDWPSFVPT